MVRQGEHTSSNGSAMKIRDRIKELRRVKASDLVPNPKNWRTHPEAQKNALRGILSEVGIADAVLVRELPDGSLMLIDGHLRAETTGDTMLPCLILDVSESEGDKILATLDPLAAMAESDAVKLDAILREVDTGSEALQEMLAALADDAGLYQTDEPAPQAVAEDEAPEVPVDPITKPGDVWTLGEHRVMCGDSMSAADVARLMDGATADLCFTSPPYGQQRDYTAESKAKVADWDGLMRGVFANLPMSPTGQVLVNLGLIHREGECMQYWDGWVRWMRSEGYRLFGWYVWDKGHPYPGKSNGRLWMQHEWVFHFNTTPVDPLPTVKKTGTGNRETWFGARAKDGSRDRETSIVRLDGYRTAGSVVTVLPEEGRNTGNNHPAAFPVRLPAEFLSMWPGTVYEPFCGSGTTLIAAEQLGRKCYGMEISPGYCDVIAKRWETLTGRTATRVAAG